MWYSGTIYCCYGMIVVPLVSVFQYSCYNTAVISYCSPRLYPLFQMEMENEAQSMKKRLNPVTENLLLGTCVGIFVGVALMFFFRHVKLPDIDSIFLFLFIVLGAIMGWLSGLERNRMQKLKQEKQALDMNMIKIRKAFKQSANKYRILIENASDAIYLTTVKGQFLLFNEATCLLSGYNRNQLKKMTLTQLQVGDEDNSQEKQGRAWLDNSVCRYEEKWKTKSGKQLILEISAKWLQVSGNELILHVGRDIVRRSEAVEEQRAREVRLFQTAKIVEMSTAQNSLYQTIAGPINDTVKLLNQLMNSMPAEQGKLKVTVDEWEDSRKVLQSVLLKTIRDLNASPSQWNINEIIVQELQHLQRLIEGDGLVAQTRFASDLPSVWGLGRDFSLAFGILFQSVAESIGNSGDTRFSVSTDTAEDQVIVTIKAAGSQKFPEILARNIDPVLRNSHVIHARQCQAAFQICRKFFDTVGGQLDIATPKGEGVRIKISIPAIRNDQKVIRVQKLRNTPGGDKIL